MAFPNLVPGHTNVNILIKEDEVAVTIQPTPVLRGREAKRFLKKVAEDLNKPLKAVSEPCLEAARKLVFANEQCAKKHCR